MPGIHRTQKDEDRDTEEEKGRKKIMLGAMRQLQKGGRQNSYTWFMTHMANYGILVENLFT